MKQSGEPNAQVRSKVAELYRYSAWQEKMAELSGVVPLISSKDRKDAAALTRRTFSPGCQYQHPRPRSAKTHTSYGVFDGDKLVAATTVELDPKLEHFGRGEYLAELKKMHPEVYITATVVDPEYRRQGLATKLRSHLKEQYRSILTGMSPTKSDPLMPHLNEQQGFRRVTVYPNGNVQYFWAKDYEQTKHADWRKSVGDAAHHVGEVLTAPIPGTPEWFVRPGKKLTSVAGHIPNVVTGKIGNGAWDVGELARKMKIACLVKAAELAEDGEHRLQGHIDFQGLDIAVENRKGSVRSGATPDGKKWRTEMKAPYGYIEAPATGKDGESIDAYVGPERNAPIAYVVHQHKPDGTGHDEDKVMLGCADEEAAKKLYLQHYDSPKFLGPVDDIPVARLKELLAKKKKIEKIAFDESAAERVLQVAKPLKIRGESYRARVTAPVSSSQLSRMLEANAVIPPTVTGGRARNAVLDDLAEDWQSGVPAGRQERYIEVPRRGGFRQQVARDASNEPRADQLLHANFTPAQHKMLNAVAEGHELDELHYGVRGALPYSGSPAGFTGIQEVKHFAPGVPLREHNRIVTLPVNMEPLREALESFRAPESSAFTPYGVRLGRGNRLSRHAIKRIQESMGKVHMQSVFDAEHAFQKANLGRLLGGLRKLSGAVLPLPVQPTSQLIRHKVPRVAAPAVRSLPGMPKVLKC